MVRDIIDKVKRRLKVVPGNVKTTTEEVRTESVATAVGNVPKRFGKENRELLK